MPEHHSLMGGKLHVYRRPNSNQWQCSTYLAGKNWRVSTKEESLSHAKDFAEDWFLELKGKNRAGGLKVGRTFKQAAEQFLLEYETITAGERSPQYVRIIHGILRVHLLPFFGDKVVSEITPGLVQEYRIHRMTSRVDPKTNEPKRPARATIRMEVVTLRQVLKAAYRHGWLPFLPDLSAPYKASGKITHRAWFSPEEYKRLYEATRAKAKSVTSPYGKWLREQFHDYVLFMANTGLRPDESARLEFRDVAIVTDEATGERILEIEVRGKRGVGYCKSMTGAVMPFERLRNRNKPKANAKSKKPELTDKIFGPTNCDLLNAPQTVLRDWGDGQAFRLSDALTGVCVFGATGSGKSSGVAKHLAYGYLAADFGGLVLCAKKDEARQFTQWAIDCGREDDLVIVDSTGKSRFNFLDWEASRPEASGGITLNVVAILDEIAGAFARSAGKAESGGGDNKFWEDALHHTNTNLVDLPVFAGLQVSLPLMRSIVNSAPQSLAQLADEKWQETSVCAQTLAEAEKAVAKAPDDVRTDFEECKQYWLQEFPQLSEKTRSIISLSFSMLVRPLITRPLRKLFSSDTNIKPEDAFDGKIIIVDLPVQDFRLAGRVANLVWKYCFQVAVLRRTPPTQPNSYLRPVFLWADEAQNFVTDFDAEYQAVARSAGGATVYLTQNRESYRRVLGNYDAVDSLLGNLQAKFFNQNSGETNEWAAKLLGERWVKITSTNAGSSQSEGTQNQINGGHSSGVTRSEQRRYYVEPATFTTLKRGGALHNYQIECVVYNGGHLFPGDKEPLPYKLITFNQK